MYLETERLIIRDFTPADAGDLHEVFGDEETMLNCEPAYTPERTRQFLTDFCIGRRGAVAAVLRESGKVIGYILLKALGENAEEDVYEIGWIFHRASSAATPETTGEAGRTSISTDCWRRSGSLPPEQGASGCTLYKPRESCRRRMG